MLVITGMGRSGTSVLAALCKGLRFDPGGGYVEGINAGLEDPEVVAVNEAILGLNPGREHIKDEAVGRIAAVRRHVIKDPRFILTRGAALGVWWQHRKDLRVLLAIRDAAEVVRSRQAHPHWFGPIPDAETQVLEQDIGGTIGLMTELGIPFRCLHFPDFLNQPGHVFEALRFGGLAFSDRQARKVWARMIDPSKVRHSPKWEGVAESPAPSPRLTVTGPFRIKTMATRLLQPVSRLLYPNTAAPR